MKAIVLAAGVGSRLVTYSKGGPKCLLEIGGKSILERQIETFRKMSIGDIVIVKGYAQERINIKGVRYYINENYAHTNMVYSLFCADKEIKGDVIISYGDILFEDRVLDSILSAQTGEIQVAVDIGWEEYYQQRFEKPYEEAESLILDKDRILDIGRRNAPASDIQAQYIGLIRLSDRGCQAFLNTYKHAKEQYSNRPWKRGRTLEEAYMTDFLQALIDDGVPVYAVAIRHGWLEFDTPSDYELVLSWFASGKLDKFCSLH